MQQRENIGLCQFNAFLKKYSIDAAAVIDKQLILNFIENNE